MTSLSQRLAVNILTPLLLLLASSVVKATLNLTLQYELREDRPPGTVIGDVKVDSGLATEYQPEVVERMRFRLRSVSDQVRLNEVTGVMVLSSELDRASLCPYADVCRLVVDVVVRPSEAFHIVRVTVDVLSVNRHAPRFPAPSVAFDVPASTLPGTVWALPAADDPDGGDEGVQTYRIAPPPTSTFALDVVPLSDGSRDVHLRLIKSLNRSADSYALTIVAADGGVPARTGSLSVTIRVSDVTDDGPRFSDVTYDVTVAENAPLMTVVASANATSDHRDAQIRYLFDDQTIRRYGQMFSMSNITGDVFVVGTVDRESHANCLLTLVAVDVARPASLPAYSRMRITVRDVNDHAPRLTLTTLSPPGGRWAEVNDGAPPGTFLAHIAVADPDTGNASVVDCAVNSTDFRLIPLGSSDFKLMTNVAFGRGHDPVYVIVITCSDRGRPPLSDFRSLNVLVIDAGPQFPAEVVSARMPVGLIPGTPVVRLNATSTDIGPEAEIVYSMSLIAGRIDAMTLDARSGWVAAKLVVGRDYINATFTYLVTATDRGNPPLSAITTLHVHVVESGYDVITGSSMQISSTTSAPLRLATGAMSSDANVGSDVIIASVVCATVIVLALITVVAVVFCLRRRWCTSKDESCSTGHSSASRSCATLDVITGLDQHSATRPDVVISGLDDDAANMYCSNYNKSSSSHGSTCSYPFNDLFGDGIRSYGVGGRPTFRLFSHKRTLSQDWEWIGHTATTKSAVAPSSDKESFSSTRPLRPQSSVHRHSSDAATFNKKPFVFTLIPPSPHNHLTVDGGTENRALKPSVFDHESDSGLSGSLTDSGRALADDVDGVAVALQSPGGLPYPLTGSYCPARAADSRRTRLNHTMSSPCERPQQPSCRRTRSVERTILELPSYDTYV